MALTGNRITDARAVNVDGNLYPEWRAQALFHVWLKFYFSGAAFDTRDGAGGVESRTFHRCHVGFQELEAPDAPDDAGERQPQSLPLIHGVLIDQRSRAIQESATHHGEDLDWMMNLMVKVPKNLSATGSTAADPRWLCREVAGQLAWLLRSSEKSALAEHGIQNLDLQTGPTLLASNPWMIRMLVVSFRMRRSTPR